MKGEVARLQEELQAQTDWALQLDRARAELQEHVQRLDARVLTLEDDRRQALEQLAATEEQLKQRTGWVQGLEAEAADLRRKVQAMLGSPAYRIGKRLGLCPRLDASP